MLKYLHNIGISTENLAILKKLEWIVLVIIGYAYWFPSPTRDQWVGVILLWLGIIIIRFWYSKRFWTSTFFDEVFVIFIGLCIMSIFIAPYETRGVILLYRPLFGFALVLSCVEHARQFKNISSVLYFTPIFSLCISIIALTASNWSGKSEFLSYIYENLPRWEIPLWEGGFNPNEIAGVISLLVPFNVWLFVKYRWWVAGIASIFLIMALGLGQSLSGILGMTAGLLIVLSPHRFWKYTTLIVVAIILIIQIAIMILPEETAGVLGHISGREDVTSMEHRGELWRSAVDILSDYPLTGAGIAMYRHPLVRADYPTPSFSSQQAVHPHNAFLQVTSDLGYPGLAVVLLWYGIAGYMLYRVDQSTENQAMTMSIVVTPALAGVLVAHAAYGLTDAIPLWDRFAFVFFWFLGLIAAQYFLFQNRHSVDVSSR